MDLANRHDVEGRRFVADLDGQVAELTYRELDARTLDFNHTFVPAALRGRGIAATLGAHALDWVRASGRTVVPSCSYVAAYLRRHPEYADLVAGWRPAPPERSA
jgi:predicted GNAT family acetyltransferase